MSKIKTKTVYLCSSCGDDHPKWNGQCPSCNEWGTLSEFKVSKDRKIINQKSERYFDDSREFGEKKKSFLFVTFPSAKST